MRDLSVPDGDGERYLEVIEIVVGWQERFEITIIPSNVGHVEDALKAGRVGRPGDRLSVGSLLAEDALHGESVGAGRDGSRQHAERGRVAGGVLREKFDRLVIEQSPRDRLMDADGCETWSVGLEGDGRQGCGILRCGIEVESVCGVNEVDEYDHLVGVPGKRRRCVTEVAHDSAPRADGLVVRGAVAAAGLGGAEPFHANRRKVQSRIPVA